MPRPADDAANGAVNRQAVVVAQVQALDIGRELLAYTAELLCLGIPAGGIDLALRIPGLVQLVQHVKLAALVGMQFQAKLAQSHFAQAAVHHVQRSNFFCHKQHPLAFGQALRNQVGNGLALAGAGRANQHKVLAPRRRHDGRQLRRIGRQRAEHLLGWVLPVQLPRLRERNAGAKRRARRVNQVRHHRRLAQVIGAFGQILPHQVLGKREHRQHHVFAHLPAAHVADGSAHTRPDAGNVQPGLVLRQVFQWHAQVHLKVLAQHFHQRGVKARALFVGLQREARAGAFALQRDGQQDERRLGAHVGLVGPRPGQKTQRNEQGIGTAFLQRVARTPVQLHQPQVQLLAVQPHKHFAPLQCLGSVRALQVFQAARLVQGLAARVLPVHQQGAGQQFQGLALGQRIFQRRRSHLQQQRPLALLEVEQRIAQRQVQQLSLPARQPVFGVQLGGRCFCSGACRQQIGRLFDGEGGSLPFGGWF